MNTWQSELTGHTSWIIPPKPLKLTIGLLESRYHILHIIKSKSY